MKPLCARSGVRPTSDSTSTSQKHPGRCGWIRNVYSHMSVVNVKAKCLTGIFIQRHSEVTTSTKDLVADAVLFFRNRHYFATRFSVGQWSDLSCRLGVRLIIDSNLTEGMTVRSQQPSSPSGSSFWIYKKWNNTKTFNKETKSTHFCVVNSSLCSLSWSRNVNKCLDLKKEKKEKT